MLIRHLTSLTIDLGTSTVINTYELEWDTFREIPQMFQVQHHS